MALSNETSKQIFVCTGGTVYTVPFYFLQDSDLTVYREDAAGDISGPLTLTTDYTLTGAGSESGGELTTVATYSDGKLIVVRNVDYTQRLDLIQGDGFRPDTLEQELDRIVMQVQQIKRRLDVAFQLPDYDTSGADTTIPVPEAGKVLSWSEDGSALVNETPQHTILENGSVTAPKIADRAVTVEKLPVGQYWTTGDAKLTIKTTPDSGWIMADDGTIGDASSGASNRANADTEDLYTLLWTNLPDAVAPVAGGRGASAAEDFAAHKPIQVGTIVGRALAVAGTGSGLTARALGDIAGEETHQLTVDEMPSHGHGLQDRGGYDDNIGQYLDASSDNGQALSDTIIEEAGGDQPHNNMQPTTFLNVMIKL
jgi:hypothetical protein